MIKKDKNGQEEGRAVAIAWTKELSVGVDFIDRQHQKLFRMTDELFEAGKNGKAKEQIGEMLGFLEEYTRTHFRDEEAYMLRLRYPGYDGQKRQHAEFVASLAKLRGEFESSGGNVVVVIKANRMVVDWLIGHVSREDRQIGRYAAGA